MLIISAEMINMLQKVGWKKDFVLKSTPILPISGWVGDNLLKKSENMKWWNGCDIEVEAKGGTEKLHIDCLYDCLNNMARPCCSSSRRGSRCGASQFRPSPQPRCRSRST